MELRKGYKQTEIGVIPEDWEIKKVQEIAEITTGAKDTQDRIDNGLYPFYVRSQTIENINSFSFDGEAVLTSGDGVGVGKIFHYVNGKFDFHQRVYNIHDFNNCHGKLFYYYFSTLFYERVMQMTAKSSVDSVRREMIADMLIPLPPTLTEQKAIATVLSDTDQLIQNLKSLIAKKQAIKQGAMQELLTGKKRLPGFSGQWEVKTIGDIAEVFGGGTPSTFNSEYWDGNINWFTPTEIGKSKYVKNSKRKITKIGFDNSSAKLLSVGSILLTSRAGIGDLAILTTEASTNQGFQSLKVFETNNNEFIYYRLKITTNELHSKASGSTFQEISPNNLRSIEFLIPNLKEQQAIAKILTDMDAEIDALENQLKKTELLKQGMMQELLTGRIRLVASTSSANDSNNQFSIAADEAGEYNRK